MTTYITVTVADPDNRHHVTLQRTVDVAHRISAGDLLVITDSGLFLKVEAVAYDLIHRRWSVQLEVLTSGNKRDKAETIDALRYNSWQYRDEQDAAPAMRPAVLL